MLSRGTLARACGLAPALLLAVPLLLAAAPAAAEGQRQGEAAEGHTGHAHAIDAEALPGEMTRSLESRLLLRGADGLGHETLVHRTVRAPGTRAPLHFHDAGGATCVLEGEMTLYLEGAEPQRAVAGECYYMPPGLEMSGVNSGAVEAVLLDIFTVPLGTPVWRVVEEGFDPGQDQFSGSGE